MTGIEPGHTLAVLVTPEPEGDDEVKGLFGPATLPPIVQDIPVEKLQEQFAALSHNIGQLFNGFDSTEEGAMRLTELAFQIEVTASGGINLIGTANVGANAAMTLTFSR